MALASVKSRQFPQHFAQASGIAKPTASVPYGATLYETDTDLWYIFTADGWKVESLPGTLGFDIAAMAADIALIKAQNQTVKSVTHSFAFGAAETAKTSPITYNGPVKHLLLVFPNTTNGVTATVTLEDASGRTLATFATAKAKNANYVLDADIAVWTEQWVHDALTWRIVLSGVPGGSGVTPQLVTRYYGV